MHNVTWRTVALGGVLMGALAAALPPERAHAAGQGLGRAKANDVADRHASANGIPSTVERFGSWVRTEKAHATRQAPDLAALLDMSDAVVKGRPRRNVGRLSLNEKHILTEYEFVVDEVINGPLVPGDVITVNLPGGIVGFPMGRRVEARTPGFDKLRTGETYYLFLRRNGGRGVEEDLLANPLLPGFVPTLRSQGVYALDARTGTIVPYAPATVPLTARYLRARESTFKEEIRSLAESTGRVSRRNR